MKIGDKVQIGTGEAEVTRKVYDQSLKKTVFYAGNMRLTGNEKPVEAENIIVKKLEAVESAIKSIPRVDIPEYPKFPEPKEFPAFPEFPKSMTVNVPDLSSIEKKLDTIIEKEDNETKELIKNALEELKKTKSDTGVISAIQKLVGIIPKSQDYTEILKEISDKLNPITQEDLKINKEQWKQLTKALSSIGGFGGGPGAVQLRSENGTILNPATEEKQDAIVTAIENITIPAPAGGATEAKQDDIITALGGVTTPSDTQPISASSLPLPSGASTEAKQDAIITKLSNTGIQSADSPSIDAFSRWRVSEPQTIFDAQLTYGLAPLLYEPITAEANATITHDATNRCALMTFAATPTGGKAYMQTYEHFRYQPGKSQLVFVTFNMIEGVADTLKFAGYSDGANGIEFQLNGTTKQITLYSDTGHGDESVAQASWNLDKLDGTGASGLLLDITKVQIFVIDFQALYVGRVRVGFDIGGAIIYVHEFTHANLDDNPYIQTANLPIRVGMTSTGTVSTTMKFICCSVLSEGGQDETQGYLFSKEGTVTAGSGTDTHILSIQPSTTFNSIANRYKFILESVDITVTGTRPVLWKLCIGQALSGTTTMIDVNGTYSATQYNILGTLSGSPAIVVAQGYAAASATTKTATSTRVPMKYPITLDAAGAARVNGRLTVIVNGIGGTSETRCILNWREIR